MTATRKPAGRSLADFQMLDQPLKPAEQKPWKQLAKVLREMGHVEDARQVSMPVIQGAGNWYLCGKLPEEYSGFSPLAYSLDVILPLVDLQQETSWAPLIPTPKAVWYQELFSIFDWKHFTRLVLWFEILFGWVSSLLLVAVVSGLTKRREE